MTKKSSRRPTVKIPECPAADKCRVIEADCTVCESLPESAWRDHVFKVLSK